MLSKLSFQAIAEQFVALSCDEFYQHAVKQFAQLLGVKRVKFVQCARLSNSYVRPLSAFCSGHHIDEPEYQLTNTPCEQILDGKPYSIYGHLKVLYPQDTSLLGHDFISYITYPLVDNEERVIGHIAIYDEEDIAVDEDDILRVLKTLSRRVTTQIERTNHRALAQMYQRALSLTSQPNFFNSVTQLLGDFFTADYALIGQFDDDNSNLLTLDAMYHRGRFVENRRVKCLLPSQPNSDIFSADMFGNVDDFTLLRELDISACALKTLHDRSGNVIGILGVLSCQTIECFKEVSDCLTSFSSLAATHILTQPTSVNDNQRMLETTSDRLAFVDQSYCFQAVNKAYLSPFEQDERDVLKQPMSSLHGLGMFEEELQPYIDEALTGCQITTESKPSKCSSDGRFLQTHFQPHVDEFGQITGVVISTRDITSLKQVELELRRSEERFQQLYNKTPSMFFTIDDHWVIRSANAFGAHKLGFKTKALIGKNMLELYPMVDQMAMHERFTRCFEQPKKVHEWEIKQLRSDDYHLWVKQTAQVVVTKAFGRQLFLASEDITEKHRLSQKLSYQASHDSLTGLTNRLAFERALRSLVAHKNDSVGQVHVLCFIDLDHFKTVNDTCGHLTGDELLRRIAKILSTKVRKTDVLARIGGDEFAILMADCRLDKAIAIAESIREAIQDYVLVWKDQSFQVGASVGLTVFDLDKDTIVDAMSAADEACYSAKEAGRNRVFVYCEKYKKGRDQRADNQWLSRLNLAINGVGFDLFIQPIVSNNPAITATHYEVLLRYNDNGVYIPAAGFLAVAKQHQLLVRVDEWVINETFARLSRQSAIPSDSFYTINVSGAALADSEFLEFILFHLRKYQLNGCNICFEITEEEAVADLLGTINFITELKKQGCLFALDNFGNGLASFSHFKSLPVDIIKISGECVELIEQDKVIHTVVRSINDVAHVMGKITMACYVENQQIRDRLTDIGIDYCQGYFIGKPRVLR